MKYSISKLTKTSNDNINVIFENYSKYMTYDIKKTYFIKLLYTLLDRCSEIELEYTVNVSEENPNIQSNYMSDEISSFIKENTFKKYTTQFKIKHVTYNIQFYYIIEINIER